MKKNEIGKIGIRKATIKSLRKISMFLYVIMGVLSFVIISYMYSAIGVESFSPAGLLGSGVLIIIWIAAYIVLFFRVLQTGMDLKIEIKKKEVFSLLMLSVLATWLGFILSLSVVTAIRAIF